jgi:hypothetical protein
MATDKAPVKVTGGGGFGFADRVNAWFLAHLLTGGLPLGPAFGVVTKLDFEVRDKGWLLDDLAITLDRNGEISRCALSIKSNEQVTTAGFPSDFVAAIWQQQRQTSSSDFLAGRDLLALGVGRISLGVRTAWDQLLSQALEADPERLLERLRPGEGQSSEGLRRLFVSLHCPLSICPAGPNPVETIGLIRSIRVLSWDFESVPSESEANAIELCRNSLVSSDSTSATSLWHDLQRIAANARAVGASLALTGLLERLRDSYSLKCHPDYRADWERVRALSEESRASVKSQIGQGISVARSTALREIEERVSTSLVTAVVGESGSGKSALVAALAGKGSDPLVWLDHTHFDHSTQAGLAHAIGLRRTLPDLLAVVPSKSGLIVFDSLEKYSSQAARRVAELITAVANTPTFKCRIVVTCQAHMWDRTFRELISAGVNAKQISAFELGLPPVSELCDAISTVAPRIVPLLLRPELQRLLCNLKVLDWLVIEDTLRAAVGTHAFVGETDVIDWIWDRWTGSTADKHARAGMLIRLGEHDGNTLGSPLSIRDLNEAQQRTVGTIERDDLVSVRHGRVSFKHDLLGDWARLNALLAYGPSAVDQITNLAQYPRWQRAVRLYAQSLLEHEGGVPRWVDAVTHLQDGDQNSVIAADIFLDAIIFSGNAGVLLEELWPRLTANNGHLLRRFLKRFLYVATIPDPRALSVADVEDVDWLSTLLRFPLILYWYPVLRALAQHRVDVCKYALVLTAEVCELWLRTIPREWGGRTDAATLALALARETQGLRVEDVWFSEKADQKIYEALCHATRDYPEEVSQVLLELCHRRPESPQIVERKRAFQERQRADRVEQERSLSAEERLRRRSLPPPILRPWRRPKGPPATDGPHGRVSESFQAAILNTTALLSVANVRPAVARELLLAVCIDEPKSEDYSDAFGMDFGTAHWPGGYPAMYFRGPFLRFLEAEPNEAIESITRLVNHATERWAQRFLRKAPADLDPDHYSLELNFATGPRRFVGTFHVFGWYRESMVNSNPVVCALMALEKWLYDGIDQGRDMSPWLDAILSRSNSVAVLGLLTAVGLRKPELFVGSLQVLLGNWVLLTWQQHFAPQDETWRIGMIPGWAKSGQKVYEQVVKWHTLPHRKACLRDVGIQLFLTNRSTRDFMTSRREQWLEQLARNPDETLELLAARFDISNYSVEDLGDRVQFNFQWPEHLRERTEQRVEAAQKSALAVSFPHRCRRILDGEQQTDAETFWKEFQQITGWIPEPDAQRTSVTPGSICAAGIAVLVIRHPQWLAQHPERRTWCVAQLERLASTDPPHSDVPQSVLDTAAEAFMGEAAVALLPELDTLWVRELVARGVMAFYYTSTRCVMRQAFRQRQELGEDFDRIVNLMICWSGLRWAWNHTQHTESGPAAVIARSVPRLVRVFVERRLPVTLIPFERIAAMTQKLVERIDARNPAPWGRRFLRREGDPEESREVDRSNYWLDAEVLSSGFGFLGNLSVAVD